MTTSPVRPDTDAATPPWTVAVLGPGGVGGLLAALLARAGHRVICLAGPATAATLREDGLRVRSAQFGDLSVPVEAATELREPVDLCLVTVKGTHLAAALEKVPRQMLDEGLVLPLLNGVEHLAGLRRHFGECRVVAGVVRVESTRVAPGAVEHGSPFTEIDVAGPAERLGELCDALRAAGVTAQVVGDESALLWTKLAFLAPFALLTTWYGMTIGDVRAKRRAELSALVREAAAVGEACGASIDVTRSLALYEAFPRGARSSMQRDAEAGRPLELDAIGGALLRAARRHGVSVPLATRLVTDLRRRHGS
ncbi:ketopantoate reductase family protein [Streptomyces sp. AC602_WCS936]|uniref:ketopantoate reductase family protein n=1 Tax=Streptomyces sp. AC602_WCS936 TaxID=2823685 RepID=UPI001C2538A5|nr:2-dehydropantoate 2-reductase [Streptomyces sp. AC602_WCS936]